jgi:hypothetical protein
MRHNTYVSQAGGWGGGHWGGGGRGKARAGAGGAGLGWAGVGWAGGAALGSYMTNDTSWQHMQKLFRRGERTLRDANQLQRAHKKTLTSQKCLSPCILNFNLV